MTALTVEYQPTGMRATLTVEAAVVRSAKPRLCSSCRRKRVLYALTFVDVALGNPDYPWRCAPCSGLRPGGRRG